MGRVTQEQIDIRREIGAIIREHRTGAKISQFELALEIGIDPSCMWAIEHGRMKVRIWQVVLLAAFFKKPMATFMAPVLKRLPEETEDGEECEISQLKGEGNEDNEDKDQEPVRYHCA